MCAHLVEIETKGESEWLAATFFMKGKLFSYLVVNIVSNTEN